MNDVTPPDPAPRPGSRVRVARTGVLPVTVMLLVVVLLAGALFSGVRHQLALSLTRVDPAFVEVYFAPSVTPASVCTAVATRRGVPFSIAVHGGSARQVGYTVEVRGADARAVQVTGSVPGEPGQVAARTVIVPVRKALLRQRHEVSIAITGTDQQLLVHCGRGARTTP